MKVILASASPRRQALLQQIGITPLVCPADFAEGSGTASQAQEVALHNAAGKCAAVAAKMGDELPVIAADTIVVIDNFGQATGCSSCQGYAAAFVRTYTSGYDRRCCAL